MVYSTKLNDKGEFMSRKKIIITFNTWIGIRPYQGERVRLAADGWRITNALESSSS